MSFLTMTTQTIRFLHDITVHAPGGAPCSGAFRLDGARSLFATPSRSRALDCPGATRAGTRGLIPVN
jgi:hypothetical protein